MAAYSLTFYVGGHLVNHGKIEFKELMRTLMAVMMSIIGVSGATSYFMCGTDSVHCRIPYAVAP